ncbi:MAG: hypothetical protein H3C43_12725, partial [Leptonema sp. (in: Bacteria)]|nr:hypothetical protein [Leptonema sp. (in: bacteria)]
LIGGLWHGASYNFLIWGMCIGLLLSIEGFIFRRGWAEWPTTILGRMSRLILTWFLLISSSVFFFSPSLERTIQLLSQMFSFNFTQQVPVETGLLIYSIVAIFFFQFIEEWPEWFAKLRRYESWLLPIVVIVVFGLILQYSGQGKDFFYFQF